MPCLILRLVQFLFVGCIPNLRRVHLCDLLERADQGLTLMWYMNGAVTCYASHLLAQIGNEDDISGGHLSCKSQTKKIIIAASCSAVQCLFCLRIPRILPRLFTFHYSRLYCRPSKPRSLCTKATMSPHPVSFISFQKIAKSKFFEYNNSTSLTV